MVVHHGLLALKQLQLGHFSGQLPYFHFLPFSYLLNQAGEIPWVQEAGAGGLVEVGVVVVVVVAVVVVAAAVVAVVAAVVAVVAVVVVVVVVVVA